MVPNVVEENQKIEEEIEMLDFLSPIEDKNIEDNSQVIAPSIATNKVDLTKANELIDKLEDDLRKNNYRISIVKENDIKEMRYTITIDKE